MLLDMRPGRIAETQSIDMGILFVHPPHGMTIRLWLPLHYKGTVVGGRTRIIIIIVISLDFAQNDHRCSTFVKLN